MTYLVLETKLKWTCLGMFHGMISIRLIIYFVITDLPYSDNVATVLGRLYNLMVLSGN